MIKKGIILAGGMGSRVGPSTKAISKQLIPIADKPIIFYSLSILMLLNIKNILIIVKPSDQHSFKSLLGNGKSFGIKITYATQNKPKGLPDAFILGEEFIGKSNVALILGDNFFYAQNLSSNLIKSAKLIKGAKILLHKVAKPELFGVAKVDNKNKITSIKEKPKKYLSDLAITGLYFFDNKVIEYSKKLKPSKRGEIEIVDLLNKYKKTNNLYADFLGRGGAWLDTGSMDDYYKTSAFVSAVENRQGLKIACLEEIAFNNKWINKSHIKKSIIFYGDCDYSKYLSKLI
jgi:glucose-1-phosphate thymidylyltransferase